MLPNRDALLRLAAWTLSAAVAGAVTGWMIAVVARADMGLWLVARASGIAAYVLLTAVTLLGLLLSGPRRAGGRASGRGPGTHRLDAHSALALFVLVFTGLHIVVLALDPWAKVGWLGVLLPFGADYRPLPVTLGLLATWSVLLSAATAALAGRLGARLWQPLHAVAGLAWVLAWAHGVLAGTDTAALTVMYAVTGVLVVVAAVRRYAGRSASDARRTQAAALRVSP